MSFSTEAVVVGAVDVGESHRIVRFLTPEHGRISAMVRQARSSKRRYAGLLDPGTQLELVLHRRRAGLALQSAELLRGLDRPRGDLDRLTRVAYGCELCAMLAPEEQAARRLYRLLVVWLDLLEGPAPVGLPQRLALEAKALTFAGITPALTRCVACSESLEGELRFSPDAGGAQHTRCGPGVRVRADDLIWLEALRRTPLADGPEGGGERVRWLLTDFAEYQLGKGLKSRSMLSL